jgi:hypothetical protein
LRRKQAKQEALMRYINEQNEEDNEDIIPEENRSLKGAVVGFFYTLYLVLIYPIANDKALKKKLLFKIVLALIIILLASWFSPVFKYEQTSSEQNFSTSSN